MMNKNKKTSDKQQNGNDFIADVSGSLPSIRIDKVPIYLKNLFDHMRSKKIKIDDEEIIKKLWFEYEKELFKKLN